MSVESSAKIWLVADDYGLSPAISLGIRELIEAGRLSGTGCMTLFPEWRAAAEDIKACPGFDQTVIGLHMTLTDFAPLTGKSALAPDGVLPPLKSLITQAYTQSSLKDAVFAELDYQLDAFENALGRGPHYLDGHQHVHFLPPVRAWLKARFERLSKGGRIPWLRGAPSARLASGLAMKAKVAFVRGLATGFDREMRNAGYTVSGPLAGFYDWSNPADFEPAMHRLSGRVSEGAVVMCHPGAIDDMLKSRDSLVDARKTELAALMDKPLFALKRRSDLEVAHADR